MDMRIQQNQQTPDCIPHLHVVAHVTKTLPWLLYKYHVTQ